MSWIFKGKRERERVFLLVVLISLAFCGCGQKVVSLEKNMFGTVAASMVLSGRDPAKTQGLIRSAFKEMERVGVLLHKDIVGSDIAKLNESRGETEVTVSPETIEAIKIAQKHLQFSEGAFDVTVTPVESLWQHVSSVGRMPTQLEMNIKLGLVGLKGVIIDETARTIRFSQNEMCMDLSPLFHGFLLDRACAFLKANGVSGGVISLGADVFAIGTTQKGKPWEVAIPHPKKAEENLAVLKLTEKACVTLRDEGLAINVGKEKFVLIVDPRTGSLSKGIMSVTVISDKAVEGDCIARSIFVLGEDKGMDLVNKMNGIDTIIVTSDLRVILSAGLKNIKYKL